MTLLLKLIVVETVGRPSVRMGTVRVLQFQEEYTAVIRLL